MKRALLPIFASAFVVPFSWSAEVAPEEKSVLDGVVLNIFSSKCISCHGASKQKGDLRLDTHEAMLKGGESGKASITPKDVAKSESLARLALPADHDDHMPPEGKPQLSPQEIGVLKWWVESGADAKVKVKEANPPADLKDFVLAKAKETYVLAGPSPAAIAAAAPPVNSRDEKVIALEKEIGSPILQVAQNDAGLTFNVINVADKFDDAMLAKFAPIGDRFADLNLGRSKVTDAGLKNLASMKNLTRLRLENTGITDAGMDALAALSKLEYLNLYGTKITDAGIAKLEKLTNLKSLYVWQTGVTKPAAEALHAKLPKLIINMGWENVIGAPVPPPVAAAPAPAPAPAPVKLDPELPVYAQLIQPILTEKCAGCHGNEKKKGEFQLHDFASLMKGGENQEKAKAVVAGKSGESHVVLRVLLPLDNEEHMPPAKKPQLADKELALIKWWIDAGASPEVKVKDAKIPADLLK